MLALVLGAVAAVLLAAPAVAQLNVQEVLARRLPGQQELLAQLDLAEARRALAATGLRLIEGPTVAMAAGVRRADSTTDGDLELDLDLPLAARPRAREAAVEALARAEPVLPLAARLEAEADLVGRYVDAWSAQERVGLRREDLQLLARWIEIAHRRSEAGADPPFEGDLVESERRRAQTLLSQGEWEWRLAWGRLRALADLPAQPTELAVPIVRTPASDSLRARFTVGPLRAAPAVRLALAASLLRLDAARNASRWSVRSSFAREGEENVSRLGLAWRVPRADEKSTADRAADSAFAVFERAAQAATTELDARFESALAAEQAFATASEFAPDRALAALEARLTEGKSELAEILSIRRQLLTAQESEIERVAAIARASQELHIFTIEVQP